MFNQIIIQRTHDNGIQTTGILSIADTFFTCKTLELSYKNNLNHISCIPAGYYILKKRWSLKHGNHFQILNVPNRSGILIHAANYASQLQGCIAVGNEFKKLNNDDQLDVVNSRGTLKQLYSICNNLNILIIKNKFNLKPENYAEKI